jgi:hypothetical protein
LCNWSCESRCGLVSARGGQRSVEHQPDLGAEARKDMQDDRSQMHAAQETDGPVESIQFDISSNWCWRCPACVVRQGGGARHGPASWWVWSRLTTSQNTAPAQPTKQRHRRWRYRPRLAPIDIAYHSPLSILHIHFPRSPHRRGRLSLCYFSSGRPQRAPTTSNPRILDALAK